MQIKIKKKSMRKFANKCTGTDCMYFGHVIYALHALQYTRARKSMRIQTYQCIYEKLIICNYIYCGQHNCGLIQISVRAKTTKTMTNDKEIALRKTKIRHRKYTTLRITSSMINAYNVYSYRQTCNAYPAL